MLYLSKYRFPAHYLMNNCMYTKHNEYQVINFKVSHRNKDEASTGDVQVQHKNLSFHCLRMIRTHFSIYPLNLMKFSLNVYEFKATINKMNKLRQLIFGQNRRKTLFWTQFSYDDDHLSEEY